jgi:hypothetical protein
MKRAQKIMFSRLRHNPGWPSVTRHCVTFYLMRWSTNDDNS